LRPTSPLVRVLQLFALAGLTGLLALLIWRVVDSGSGARLVAEVRTGKRPKAPQFTLPVLWAHTETWPKRARSCAATRW
jgi:hypothetical protein